MQKAKRLHFSTLSCLCKAPLAICTEAEWSVLASKNNGSSCRMKDFSTILNKKIFSTPWVPFIFSIDRFFKNKSVPRGRPVSKKTKNMESFGILPGLCLIFAWLRQCSVHSFAYCYTSTICCIFFIAYFFFVFAIYTLHRKNKEKTQTRNGRDNTTRPELARGKQGSRS